MTFNEIEKEFDERFTPDWWKGFGVTDDIDKMGIEGIKSFLKQSFIKYLENECERLEKLKHDIGYKVFSDQIKDEDAWVYAEIYSDQITHLQAQIKELQ